MDLFAPTSEVDLQKRKTVGIGQFISSPPLPDSGGRTLFDTGAVRDAQPGKGHFMDIPPIALQKLARRFEDGAVKYGRLNWQKGIPLSSFQNSMTRHTLAAAAGLTDEDHLGAILWNAAVWAWTEQEIAAGRLPKSLDDLPFRSKVTGWESTFNAFAKPCPLDKLFPPTTHDEKPDCSEGTASIGYIRQGRAAEDPVTRVPRRTYEVFDGNSWITLPFASIDFLKKELNP